MEVSPGTEQFYRIKLGRFLDEVNSVTAQRQDIEPRYLYGVTEAAVEIAQCDLSSIIVGTDDAISRLIKRLGEEGLNYELIDLCLKNNLV